MKFEKAQHRALEEESKLVGEQDGEFEFETGELPGQALRPSNRSTVFDAAEWQDKTEWESHLIGQATRPTLDDPERSALGKVLKKLVEYNARPFSILDEEKVEEMIDEKTKELHKEIGVSQDIALSVLIKNNWDVSKAKLKLKYSHQYL